MLNWLNIKGLFDVGARSHNGGTKYMGAPFTTYCLELQRPSSILTHTYIYRYMPIYIYVYCLCSLLFIRLCFALVMYTYMSMYGTRARISPHELPGMADHAIASMLENAGDICLLHTTSLSSAPQPKVSLII